MALFLVVNTVPAALALYFEVGVVALALLALFLWQVARDEKNLTDDDKINRDFW